MASISTAKKKKPQASAEDSSAFGAIAERFRRAGDLERAVSLCQEGLQKFPDQVSARVTLGWSLLELGKYDAARIELEQVLRRRPDNLAAIRALAELHDRSEQTMNLPMDGPGQWPPTEDAVEEAATVAVADSVVSLSTDGDEAVVLTADPETDALAAYLPHEEAAVAPADLGVAMWSALPATEPVASESFAATAPEQEVGVSEADIAALIAEAESLEAAAELQIDAAAELQIGPAAQFQEAPDTDEATLVLDAGIDLVSFEEAAFEAASQVVDDAPGFQLESVSLFQVEAGRDILADTELSLQAEAEHPVDVDAQPALAFDAEPVVQVEAAAQVAIEAAPIVEVPIAVAQPVRSPIIGLEGFLAKVQTRRQQLVTQSVA